MSYLLRPTLYAVRFDGNGEQESGVTLLKQTAVLLAFFAADQ